MKIAFIVRSTLHSVPGGDTIQVLQTAKHLHQHGIVVSVKLAHEKIRYADYDAFHFFNLGRPADILVHLPHIRKPVFLSPILVDYNEYDQLHRRGISGAILKMFSADGKEYVKTLGRALRGNDHFPPLSYLLKGQKKSIREILEKTPALLPNSAGEYHDMVKKYGVEKPYSVVPNGIDEGLFSRELLSRRQEREPGKKTRVLCVARIEGIKNQLNLVKALNNTEFDLTIAGAAAPNQKEYEQACRKIAAENVVFTGQLSQDKLVDLYLESDVHVLPSWFETCGLSSLEAAAMGCRIVVTDKGYPREYFGEDAYYCEPGDPGSILAAVRKAAKADTPLALQERIYNELTWEAAAEKTRNAYLKVLNF